MAAKGCNGLIKLCMNKSGMYVDFWCLALVVLSLLFLLF